MTLSPETARYIDDLVARAQADGRTPSLVCAVVRDGAVAHFSAAGTDPATGQAPTPDMQFRIGSITKTFTATLLMQLRDEGKLALDDLLYRHLPGSPVGSAITLRQLLGHISGLQREPDGQWWERTEGSGLPEFLAALTPDKIAYPPHRSFHYSNLAYGLLGAVIGNSTGQGWAELVAERIVDPLGMNRTSYRETEPFARGFVVHPWHGTLREEPRTDTRAMAPAGQLWSTCTDMATWAGFLSDPDAKVLAPATLTEMCAPVAISDLESWSAGQGLGWELYRSGERVFAGHSGSMPGYQALLQVHRPSRTGIIIFATAYTIAPGAGIELTRLLSEVLDREPVRPAPWHADAAPAAPHELEGSWWWMGREFRVTWHPGASPGTGELVMQILGYPRTPWRFTQESADVWRCHSGSNDGELLQIRRGSDGTPIELDIATMVHTRTP